MAFEAWYDLFVTTARANGLGYLVGEPAAHRDAFEDGLSPAEELSEQVSVARGDLSDAIV